MKKVFNYLITCCLLSLIFGCGGGGSSSSSSTSAASGASQIGGNASTGAPIENAVVEIYDNSGVLIGTTTTDSSGNYSVNVDSNVQGPFVIKVAGDVADGSAVLYSVAQNKGVVNVNQITNAISSSVSTTGDPASLIQGPISSSGISSAESAYQTALANMTNAVGFSDSLISGVFNSNYDKLLDNIQVVVSPSGSVSMVTSAGSQSASNDLLPGVLATSAFTSATIAAGNLPSASTLSNLPALPSASMLTIGNLEYLRNKLRNCFSLNSSSRGTPSSPATECSGLDSPVGDYLHSGYFWLDRTSGCSTSNPYCLGLFGYMLSDSTYDNLIFLPPQIIRPLDSSATTWLVKFPVRYAGDSSLGSLGDAISSSYMVIKKYPSLVTSQDPGWRFYGDQRTVNSFIESNAQRIENIFTGAKRYETGLNIYIDANRLRQYPGNVYVNKVTVTDLDTSSSILPTTGITLYNRGSTSGGLWSNACGGFMSLSQNTVPSSCSGVLRLSYLATSNTYQVSSSDSYLGFWPGSPGTKTIGSGTGFLTDSQISLINRGHPFKFQIELSNGSVLEFTNRIQNPPWNTADVVNLNYPEFTTASKTSLSTYTGGNNGFPVSWETLKTSRPYSASIYWNFAAYSNTSRMVQANIDAKSITLACTGSGAISCGNAINWGASNKGILQLRSRDGSGFQYFSQIRQY